MHPRLDQSSPDQSSPAKGAWHLSPPGLRRPGLFGRLALLSPSLSGPLRVWQPWLDGNEQPDARLSVWLGAGTYEGSIHRDAEQLAELLRHHDVAVETLFKHQGYSFGTWREAATAMLRYFLALGREDAVAHLR